ncbi:MAG: hypothetical protein WCI51_02370 [Lentisphaerota bacterium]
MTSIIKLRKSILDCYVDSICNKGPMYIFMKEAATGYIHSFYMRALMAEWERTHDAKYLDAAKSWVEFSIRLQGSYGDSAAFNMGYLFETKDNTPHSWFIADTLDQAYGMLNVAASLDPHDPLYIKILDSVLRYDQYIQQWYLGTEGFAVGYLDGEYSATDAYHTAGSRGISYYAAMYQIFGKKIFKEKGLALLEYVLNKLDFDSNFHGSPLHNRSYVSDAMVNAYYVLAYDNEIIRSRIKDKVSKEIIPWAKLHQAEDGFWPHDRFGHQPGAMPKIDKSDMGSYSWGMVFGIEIFAKYILTPDPKTEAMLDSAYAWLEDNLVPGDVSRWGYHSRAILAITSRLSPECLFPFGSFLPSQNKTKTAIFSRRAKRSESKILQTV